MLQPWLVPTEYAGYPYGSAIEYGGATYIVGNDGYMYQQCDDTYVPEGDSGVITSGDMTTTGGVIADDSEYEQPAPQAYQIPSGYESYQSGTVINYGGVNYTIDNGVMYPNQ